MGAVRCRFMLLAISVTNLRQQKTKQRAFATDCVKRIILYKPSILFVEHRHIYCGDLDQMPQNAVSDQGHHCLLTECSTKI